VSFYSTVKTIYKTVLPNPLRKAIYRNMPQPLKVAEAFGMATTQIDNHRQLKEKIKQLFDYEGPILCSVELKHGEKIIPKLEFGKPIEDPSPQLDRKEFLKNMLVDPIQQNTKYQGLQYWRD